MAAAQHNSVPGPNVDAMVKAVVQGALAARDAVLPTGSEHHYLASTSSEYKGAMAALRHLSEQVVGVCEAVVGVGLQGHPHERPSWADPDEVQDWVAGLLDDMAALVDTALDQHRRGHDTAAQQPPPMPGLGTQGARNVKTALHAGARAEQGMPKPQARFDPPVDNSGAPFVHWAPHLEPLVPTGCNAEGLGPGASHPMRFRLDALTYEPWQLQALDPVAPKPLDATPLHWVDTPEALACMVAQLRTCTHVAIDLENHSFRSFQGFTCLMQLSSRDQDWVVDCLALRAELGPALAGLAADPHIVKVLHGCDHDVLWLQRDFRIYLVNVFDSGQAARVLGLPSAGLAHLLDAYCGVKADKRYQLADWRVRPLAPELLAYARADTHYLLYIHDRLKQQLLELGDKVPPSLAVPLPPDTPPAQAALRTVLERSRALCATLYSKEVATPESCEHLMQRVEGLAPMQRSVLVALALWRDRVARDEDEGTGYVLPRAQLIELAKNMPGRPKDVLRVVGANRASEVLRRRVHEVVEVIASAKRQKAIQQVQPAQLTEASAEEASAAPPAAPSGGSAGASSAAPPTPLEAPLRLPDTRTSPALPAAEVAVRPVRVAAVRRKQGGMMGGAVGFAPAAGPSDSIALAPLPAPGSATVAPATQPAPIPASCVSAPPTPLRPSGKPGGSSFAAALVPSSGSQAADEGTEDQAAQHAAKQVLGSFALPFAVRAGPQGPGDAVSAAPPVAEQQAPQLTMQHATAAEVRAAVDQLRGDGNAPDIHIGLDGQALSAGGGAMAEQALDGKDPQQGTTDVAAHSQPLRQRSGEASAMVHAGGDVGLPMVEFVPMSLTELKRMERRQQLERPRGGGAAPKRVRYTAQLAPGAGGQPALEGEPQDQGKAEKAIASLFGEDQEEQEWSDDSDSGDEDGAHSKDPASQTTATVPAGMSQSKKRHGGTQKGRDLGGGRGRGMGSRGRGAGRGRGGGAGSRQPAFNPYDIPDDNLIKGGKRSTVMPRSGNRTLTFK